MNEMYFKCTPDVAEKHFTIYTSSNKPAGAVCQTNMVKERKEGGKNMKQITIACQKVCQTFAIPKKEQCRENKHITQSMLPFFLSMSPK